MEPLDTAGRKQNLQKLESIVEICNSENGLDGTAATPANVPAIRTAKMNSILFKVPVNMMISSCKSSIKKKGSTEDITDH